MEGRRRRSAVTWVQLEVSRGKVTVVCRAIFSTTPVSSWRIGVPDALFPDFAYGCPLVICQNGEELLEAASVAGFDRRKARGSHFWTPTNCVEGQNRRRLEVLCRLIDALPRGSAATGQRGLSFSSFLVVERQSSTH